MVSPSIFSIGPKTLPTQESSWAWTKKISSTKNWICSLATEDWTRVKVERIFLSTVAITFVATAVVCIGAFTTSVLPLSLSLVASSIVLLWKAYTLIDYDNPKAVAFEKEEATKESLAFLIRKHSLKMIFQCEILSPESFEKAYRLAVDSLTFGEILKLYKNSVAACNQANKTDIYKIPLPKESKKKFENETKNWDLSQILDIYCIDDLRDLGLVSSKQLGALQEFISKKSRLEEELSALDKELSSRTAAAMETLQCFTSFTLSNFSRHPFHEHLRELDVKASDDLIEGQDPLAEDAYKRKRDLLVESLSEISQSCKDSIEAAQRDFETARKSLCEEIYEKKTQLKNLYLEDVKKLNARYSSRSIFSARS